MNVWLHHAATQSDPGSSVYVGPRSRYGEFEIELGGDDLDRMLMDGTPLPVRVLRWMALFNVQRTVEAVYTGERLSRELALIDSALFATDSYSLMVECTFDVNDDGEAEDVRDVEINAQITNDKPGHDAWECVKVPNPSGFLLEWLKKQATEKVERES